MARKRYSDEDVLNLLRQIELSLASGSSVETACYADDEAFPGE
jgi:putative transposase